MLKKDKFLIMVFLFLFDSCQNTKTTNSYFEISRGLAGNPLYLSNYKAMKDSIVTWIDSLTSYNFLSKGDWELDSLFCYNKSLTRLVTCIESKCEQPECTMDDLNIMYGAKINNQWYFFSSNTTVYLPRKIYQKDEKAPLSFQKMHEIALKEVYSGYLNADGEVNENFFKNHFENSGWGIDSGKNKDFEKVYLQKIKDNWHWTKKKSNNTVPIS